jgi:4-aminobutyrate--pyruvate transaminase
MTHIVYPTTNFKAIEQLKIERGEGIYVYDDQGNQYLEGMAGLWCTSLGYGNQELIDATTQAMKKLSYNHMFGGKTHQVAIDLADKLSAMLPMDDARVFFGNSGSDANDSQIKMLRYYFAAIGKPEKRKIISRERSYHGVTTAAACLTGLPINQKHFDLPIDALGILRTDAPHYYRGKQGNETPEQFVDRLVANLEALIAKEGADTIASFIAEPITGASGVIVPPPGYYEKIQAVLKKNDIFFWADEVITGFGRTGQDFGCTTMNIESPDQMSLAKQLSSAYLPISAAAVRGDIHDATMDQCAAAGAFGHGYTYSGHPTAAAVALKTLEIYERDNLFVQAAQRGDYLQRRLAEFASHPLVGEVRGSGLLAAVEVVANKETGEEFSGGAVGANVIKNCQDNGLILRAVAGNSIAFCPPLIISNEQIDEMLGKFGDALDKSYQWANDERFLAA